MKILHQTLKLFLQKSWLSVFALLFIVILTNTTFDQNANASSFQIEKRTYEKGDVILVSGTVDSYNSNFKITIQIFDNSHDLLLTSSTYPKQDGSFLSRIPTNNTNWKTGGPYDISIQYGPNYIGDDTFVFYADQLPPLKQEQEIPFWDIKCNSGLVMIMKQEDGSIACVKTTSLQKLISLNWGYDPTEKITTYGLKNVYHVGEQIEFKFRINGFGSFCGDQPHITVKDYDQKIVWQSLQYVMSCPPSTAGQSGHVEDEAFVGNKSHLGYDYNNYGPLIINQTGTYFINISWLDGNITKQFTVISQSPENITPTQLEQNNTITLGDIKYDTIPFLSDVKGTMELDGISFTYAGNGPVTKGDCYGTWVNQTQAKNFSIKADDEFGKNLYQCWPPSDYPPQIMENGKPVNILPLRYAISFFDMNQTSGVAECSSNICPLGNDLYLVKQGWNLPMVFDYPSLLKFRLSINSSVIHAGYAIGVDMSDNNTQPRSIRVPFGYNYSFRGSSLFPCDYGPFRIAVFEGNVSAENWNSTEPLHFYQPGDYTCQAPTPGKFWIFQPLNNTATLVCHLDVYCNVTMSSRHISFNGYWDDKDRFHTLDEGNYTVVASDEWGHLAIQRFTVINSTR